MIGRCQLHKIRNVKDHLPGRMRTGVERRMRAAYHAGSALEAEAQLTALARELDKTHPSAAASLREGLAETLTVLALDVPPTLARTLRSTNAIESMIGICREHAKNVKRWRDGQTPGCSPSCAPGTRRGRPRRRLAAGAARDERQRPADALAQHPGVHGRLRDHATVRPAVHAQ